MQKLYSDLTFFDLIKYLRKYKFKILIIFILINLLSIFYIQYNLSVKQDHKAIFYSDLISFQHNKKNDLEKKEIVFDYEHQSLIKSIYLMMHRDTGITSFCKEFKVSAQDLMSSIECLGTNISKEYFKSLIFDQYLTLNERFIGSITNITNADMDLQNKINIEKYKDGVTYISKYDPLYKIFIILFINLFLVFLIILHFIFNHKK